MNIDVPYPFVWEQVANRTVLIGHVELEKQAASGFMKTPSEAAVVSRRETVE